MHPRLRASALLLAASMAAILPALAQDPPAPKPEAPPLDAGLDPEREILREARADTRSGKPDMLPILRNPLYRGALEAANMDPEEWVLAVTIGKTALAFPIHVLNRGGVLVDTVEGTPILVCWSPLCRTGAAFSRSVDGQALDFGHAGLLYRSEFLLYDTATKSLWLNSAGRALTGKARGRRLDPIPCRFLKWDVWRRARPDTKVLAKDPAEPDHARDVFDARNRALKLQFGLGVSAGDEERLYDLSQLERIPLVQESVGGVPLAVVFHAASRSAVAWERTLEGRVLDLRRAEDAENGLPRLEETGEERSVFDAVTGACVTGPLKGKALVPVRTSFWEIFAWTAHHPRGSTFRASVPPPVDLPDVPK